MPPLADLQAALCQALLGGDAGAAAAMVAPDGLAADARLDIYRHHVFTTLTAALASTFPVVCRLVDARFFRFAADAYIRRHPPAGPCLFEYGASFADFLEGFEPSRHLTYLPDVARLEWALSAAAHAEDAAPLDPGELRRLAESDLPRLLLRLDPSLALLASPWPVDRIWRANQPTAEDGAGVDLASGGVWLEVRRDGGDAALRRIDGGTFAFRRALAGGQRLEEAAAAALEADAAFDLDRAVASLFAEQLPVGFAVGPGDA